MWAIAQAADEIQGIVSKKQCLIPRFFVKIRKNGYKQRFFEPVTPDI